MQYESLQAVSRRQVQNNFGAAECVLCQRLSLKLVHAASTMFAIKQSTECALGATWRKLLDFVLLLKRMLKGKNTTSSTMDWVLMMQCTHHNMKAAVPGSQPYSKGCSSGGRYS
ncbi:uncharacterized protein LOC142786558 [Rhipicephalus microplus]|uniref:uncharacterized protein LOC142786558 n=1 Tax=Rhipicephalus microplus TaxID=6941 RepID=UPI003F6D3283